MSIDGVQLHKAWGMGWCVESSISEIAIITGISRPQGVMWEGGKEELKG